MDNIQNMICTVPLPRYLQLGYTSITFKLFALGIQLSISQLAFQILHKVKFVQYKLYFSFSSYLNWLVFATV